MLKVLHNSRKKCFDRNYETKSRGKSEDYKRLRSFTDCNLMGPKRMPTVNFKLLRRLSETSARLGHNLKHHLTDSVVQSSAWDPNAIIVCRCFKSSKRSVNSSLKCLGSKLRIKFDFYCGCANERSNFRSRLNTRQHNSLTPIRSLLDYGTGCLETGHICRATLCHTWYLTAYGQNEWNKRLLNQLLTSDSNYLNPIWQLYLQTAVTLRNSAFCRGKLVRKPMGKRPLRRT
jgi:hypothetical protein